MRHLQTVGARLALALLLVVAAVLAFVYLIVVPSLEDRLVDSRKDQVATVAERAAEQLSVDAPTNELAAGFASASNTRVIFFEIIERDPLTLVEIAEGGAGFVGGIEDDPVALRAARTLTSAQGVVTRADLEFAEAAHLPPTRGTSSSSRARSRTPSTASPSSSVAC